ncbi:hypothetical protein ABIE45_002797 [Methylobacterium sp. OAE515]|uniref:hypothetical protein n=1 Tax=Methylobacterium sp. OAE515 TaxID=2817895 RepID=UPI00178A03F2
MILPYIAVALLGGLAGLSELINRYRDAPFSVLRNWATLLLVITNAAASIATLAIIRETNLVSIPGAGTGTQSALQILIAGVGAMAILRIGISLQVSGKAVNVSLANLLQPLLTAADREVARARASHKLSVSKELMLGLDADAALRELPGICSRVISNMSSEEVKTLEDEIKKIISEKSAPNVKLINLGTVLQNNFGENVLRAAVENFVVIHPNATVVTIPSTNPVKQIGSG